MENQALSDVVSVVSDAADLEHVLGRVVDLVTRASDCHACFVYLVAEGQLRLRAASPVYRHLVGRLTFGVDEGLAGWTVRNRTSAFIRDNARDDPRTNYVAELEEERFQSMVAVPISSRAGEAIGTMVLHTVAPREFDEGLLNVLERTAALVAGAIENAQLYEDARSRVEALTRLTRLTQQIAHATDRAELYRVVVGGVRALMPCDVCRLLELDSDGRLQLVAADPPSERTAVADASASVLLDLLSSAQDDAPTALAGLTDGLELGRSPAAATSVPLLAGGERLGLLVVASHEPWMEHASEMLRAAGHLVAASLQRLELVERLTDENVARDLFEALSGGDARTAQRRAGAAAVDLERPHMIVVIRPRTSDEGTWPARAERVERALRRAFPGTVCDTDGTGARALLPLAAPTLAVGAATVETLRAVADELDVVAGASEARRGVDAARRSLTEADASARIARALHDEATVLAYRDTGAYRYLVGGGLEAGPRDHLQEALERVTDYDVRRSSQLLTTLEEYLANGRAPAATARILNIHVNTLRQRLARIEQLTELSLADEDLLALQLAIKLTHVRSEAVADPAP